MITNGIEVSSSKSKWDKCEAIIVETLKCGLCSNNNNSSTCLLTYFLSLVQHLQQLRMNKTVTGGAGGRGQTSKQTKYGLKGKSVGRVEYHRIE